MIKIKFEFPDTGEGVTEGKFLEWKVEEGDDVEEDQVVGEAETDKAVVEIPSPSDGEVKNLQASPGDTVEVGDVIMELDTDSSSESGEEQEKEDSEDEELNENSDNPVIEDIPTSSTSKESQKATDNSSNSSSGNVLALPKVRRLAREKDINLASIKTGERITEEEVLKFSGSSEEKSGDKSEKQSEKEKRNAKEVKATPSVRKLSREEDIDISKVEGSGRNGKVTREDVLSFEEDENPRKEEKDTVSEEVNSHPVHSDRNTERVEMSAIKEKTAEKMSKSRFTAPHVTHVEKVDVTKLADLREQEKDEVEPHLTYLPFMMKAVEKSLEDHPSLNAELDTDEDEIVQKKYYDFNIAVDTENGLLTPRIKNVDRKSIIELASEIGEKAEKARERKLSPKEMKNGTFSITNLGVIGGEEFTPIINYPQTAILGIGKISETAEVIDNDIIPRKTVKLSLSYDHRVIDGATAARFMNKLKENLEDPEKMLLEM